MATLGTLAVNVVADTTKFSRGMTRARGSMSKMGGVSSRVGGALLKFAGPVAIAVAALKGLQVVARNVSEAFERIDASAKVASKLGIAFGELIGLQQAAEFTGVSTNTLNMALQRMVRRVSEAAQGTGEAQGALKELGLDAKSLASQSPDEMFRRIAGAMQGTGNQADKLRLAFKLFDSEGAALVNTLALGDEGLKKVQEQAKRLGTALSGEQTDAVQNMKDAWSQMGNAMDGLWNEIAVTLAPALEGLGHTLTAVAFAAKEFFRALRESPFIQFLAEAFRDWGRSVSKALGLLPPASKKAAGGLSDFAAEAAKAKEEAALLKKEADELKKKQEELAREGERVTKSLRTPMEKLKDDVADLKRLFDAGAIAAKTMGSGIEKAAADFDKAAESKKTFDRAMNRQVGAVTRGTSEGFTVAQQGRTAARETARIAREALEEDRRHTELLRSIADSVGSPVAEDKIEVREVTL